MPHIGIRGWEVVWRLNDIAAIRHPMNHNHEHCIWQLWEDVSTLFACVLSQIRRQLRVQWRSLFPCLLNVAYTLLRNISTHCRRIHSALLRLSNCSQLSNVPKTSATRESQCRGPSLSGLKWFCRRIMDRRFFLRNTATHTVMHLLNTRSLACPVHLANCFKENSVFIRLTVCLPSAPPKFNESSLSSSASQLS